MIDKDFANTVDVIAKGLEEVIAGDKSLNQVSSHWIKQNPKWNAINRGLFAETLMEVTRWWRLLDAIVNKSTELRNKESYRLKVLTYFLIKTKDERVGEFFSKEIQDDLRNCYNQLQSQRVITESIPDWLDNLGENELGKSWTNEIKALNTLPPIVLF